ncbi:MAG: trypsin-like peptidase domain-containing protein [Comamonadaceae bacterium]|nr:trypsin-like peptidase domain-containing protein [Comamonadaceae bacterium]
MKCSALKFALLCSLLTLSSASAWAGIDCDRAQTGPEIAICSDPKLKAFDDYLAQAYSRIRNALPEALFDEVRRSQRQWIAQRDAQCGADVPCLMRETYERTAALNGFAQRYAEQQRGAGQAEAGSGRSHQAPGMGSAPAYAAPRRPAPDATAAPGHSLSPKQIYQVGAQSIVVIAAYAKGKEGVSQGSGVVIAQDVVATNCHVLEEADNAVVIFQGQPHEAELVTGNRKMDYCILRTRGLPAQVARIGRLDELTPGQRVYSIGSPRGLELTIAEGLLSAVRKQDGVPMIQTSAAISPGSSGGGLFDEYGRVIGITTFLLKDSQNLNFALPVELAEVLLR